AARPGWVWEAGTAVIGFRHRRGVRRQCWLAALALALPALGVSGGPVAAGAGRVQLYTIGSGPAFEVPPKDDPLKDACGVAVDPEGRVFVSNYYEHVVDIFAFNTAKYEWIGQLQIPEPLVAPGNKKIDGPCDLAIDSNRNLYVNNWHHNLMK